MNLPLTCNKIDYKAAGLKDVSADEHIVRVTQTGQDSHIRVDLGSIGKLNGTPEYRCVLGFTARRVLIKRTMGWYPHLIRKTLGYARVICSSVNLRKSIFG